MRGRTSLVSYASNSGAFTGAAVPGAVSGSARGKRPLGRSMTNKYPKACERCGKEVPAGEGVLIQELTAAGEAQFAVDQRKLDRDKVPRRRPNGYPSRWAVYHPACRESRTNTT